MTGTDRKISTQAARGRSGPVRYEVVDYRGDIHGPFRNCTEAFAYADAKWPDQEQDEGRTGKGWDVQVAGCETRDEKSQQMADGAHCNGLCKDDSQCNC